MKSSRGPMNCDQSSMPTASSSRCALPHSAEQKVEPFHMPTSRYRAPDGIHHRKKKPHRPTLHTSASGTPQQQHLRQQPPQGPRPPSPPTRPVEQVVEEVSGLRAAHAVQPQHLLRQTRGVLASPAASTTQAAATHGLHSQAPACPPACLWMMETGGQAVACQEVCAYHLPDDGAVGVCDERPPLGLGVPHVLALCRQKQATDRGPASGPWRLACWRPPSSS